MKWLSKKTTTPPQEMQQELPLPLSKTEVAARDAAQAKSLIGATLSLATYTAQFAASLDQVVQSNSATPKTVEALSYALWEMVSLTMNMCDQLRTLAYTFSPLSQISPNKDQVLFAAETIETVMVEISEQFDL